MVRLARHLRPYLLPILVAIALLFVQAMCDLALPDYMSRIVNDGIQQGGVINAVPSAVRQSEMDKLTVLMSGEDRARVLGDYALVDADSADYDRYVAEYPILAQEPIYVLSNVSPDETDYLNGVMGRALLAVSGIEQVLADPTGAAALSQSSGFDLSKLPAGTDVFALLAKLPDAQRAQIAAAVDQRFAALGDKMITQSAAVQVRAEYAALGVDTGSLQTGYILHIGLLMLGISLVAGTSAVAVGYLSARTAAGVARDLRRGVFTRVESFSSTEFDRFSTASLITRSTNDITQVQMVIIMIMRIVFYAPILGVGGVIRAIGKSSSMWWLVAVAVLTLIGVIMVAFSLALPRFRIIQKLIDRLNLVSRENLSGMMVIRAFNRQDFELERFDKANTDLTSTMLFVNRLMVFMMPAMMLIMNGLMLAIIWVGAHQVAQSTMQVGDMMAFMQYALQIVMSFLMLSMMFIVLPRASVSADRIAEVLAIEPVIRDQEQPKTFALPFRGSIEFDNVAFRYPGAEEDVLQGISFTAQPGQTTAFIGATGAGKSTLVNLIPRFYDVTGGAIYVNGTDIRTVTQHDLRQAIGYVPQKSTLFSGTTESNLRYADEQASDETLRQAKDISQASEFIDAAPEGMAADIAQGGGNVSGGQKQRLSIARALVKQAPIYIFDDSFSALDFKTDGALRRALRANTGESTVLIVTQRISTIKNADQIVVLDEGRMVGRGTHHELMQDCETYREIALSQLSKEELA
ncbi:MAG: ABC transporter ATP-binding protein [Anaerolineae bacterium]